MCPFAHHIVAFGILQIRPYELKLGLLMWQADLDPGRQLLCVNRPFWAADPAAASGGFFMSAQLKSVSVGSAAMVLVPACGEVSCFCGVTYGPHASAQGDRPSFV